MEEIKGAFPKNIQNFKINSNPLLYNKGNLLNTDFEEFGGKGVCMNINSNTYISKAESIPTFQKNKSEQPPKKMRKLPLRFLKQISVLNAADSSQIQIKACSMGIKKRKKLKDTRVSEKSNLSNSMIGKHFGKFQISMNNSQALYFPKNSHYLTQG
mmetsp:Transcript_5486/g.6229  ORF Transcript_5486/g.6229 Transcript_5486/m.6229 type:complete len:156 (+) Transcript_5486:102-569(+)